VGDPDDQFSASPTVYKGKVFVGNLNGRLYAVDRAAGGFLWKYPPNPQPPLLSQFLGNPSGPGVASSATVARLWILQSYPRLRLYLFGSAAWGRHLEFARSSSREALRHHGEWVQPV